MHHVGSNLIGIKFTLSNYFQISLYNNTYLLILRFDNKINYFLNFRRFWSIKLIPYLKALVPIDKFHLWVGILVIRIKFNLDVIDYKLMSLEQEAVFRFSLEEINTPLNF